jgi:hypothetical protein
MRKLVSLRTVAVNYDLPPEEVLGSVGRQQNLNPEVVAGMPRSGKGIQTVTVEFYEIWPSDTDAQLAEDFAQLGYVSNPYAVARVNEVFPGLADYHPNGAHWQDNQGRWCYLAYFIDNGLRCVYADYSDSQPNGDNPYLIGVVRRAGLHRVPLWRKMLCLTDRKPRANFLRKE